MRSHLTAGGASHGVDLLIPPQDANEQGRSVPFPRLTSGHVASVSSPSRSFPSHSAIHLQALPVSTVPTSVVAYLNMGGSSSVEKFLALPLTPQRKFPFTVNQRFCQSRTTTFVLQDNFWTKTGPEGYSVKDAFSGKEVFRVEPSIPGVTPNDKTKWLVDAYKIPVAHINETRTYTTAYNVHVGKEEDYYLTQIEIKYVPLHNNACYAEYQNPETGEKSRIGIHGLWRQRRVFIYLDRGMTGGRQAIAKIFRPELKNCDFGTGEYHVEITSGVDIAFIVMVCAAMDDALQQDIDADKKR